MKDVSFITLSGLEIRDSAQYGISVGGNAVRLVLERLDVHRAGLPGI
ncbi:MAG: hypothetical protein IT210_25345, partial [Armatimonadetes bacterium]|nr:hypothetical protein [Armatimonadota bacterium]